MKKLCLVFAICLFTAAAFAQESLGDVARANRAKKHSNTNTVKLDDDSMPHSTGASLDTAKKTDEASADNKKTDEKSPDAKETNAKDAAKKDPAEEQKLKNEELKKQIDTQSKEIATLQRELDIAQREAKLRASAYYGDAGTMLRDQARFAEDTRKEQDEINTKKQALDAAQGKLADLQEQARKSGIRSE
jgi:predicted RNase H-like nuclease (RuvC/YqgF family)